MTVCLSILVSNTFVLLPQSSIFSSINKFILFYTPRVKSYSIVGITDCTNFKKMKKYSSTGN